MKENTKKLWKFILQLLLSALTGAGATFGIMSCTVNSGNREISRESERVSPYQYQNSNLQNWNNSSRSDTVRIIKESNTIYTND